MREIKFRIFDKQEEEFLNEEDYAINFVGTIFKACLDEEVFEVLDADMYIVTQYTGLKDKNDVEIYEGDILSHHLQGNRFVEYGSPFKNYGGYMLVSKNGMRGTLNDSDKLYEVIGNIYENKELLNTDG